MWSGAAPSKRITGHGNFSFVPTNQKIRKNTKVKIARSIKKHAFKRFWVFKKVGNIHTKVHAKYENGSF